MSATVLSPHPREVITRKALIVWVAAVLVYIVAITGRTSFGVASVDAIDRFGVDASRIAVFTAVQVGVYALAQIPMGMLIDRFGPRKLLVYGAVIMAAGQILLGFTSSYWVAIGARVLIGAGDATAFLSVMRILPYWFPLKKTPLFTQMTSALGQLGQFLSAVPFLAVLQGPGWTPAFVSLGAVGVLIAIAAGVAVADTPESWAADQAGRDGGESDDAHGQASRTENERIPVGVLLATILREPLCWQGFFNHYSGMLFQIVFTLLWGVPMMTLGMGLSAATVGMVLTLNVIASVCAGPLLGPISARLGTNRILATFVMSGAIGLAWIIFFLPEEPRGIAAIIVVNVIMALFTPSSNFGFDDIREGLDRRIVATATGMANMGGFFGGMITAQAVGFLLDFSSAGRAYTWDDFRFAWISVIIAWAIGLLFLFIFRTLVERRRRAARDVEGPTSGTVRVVDESES
ncbi:MFS transporter [Corynebacterium halotolerans]|uniref:Transporter n=1 Tax=Corynebacterium halotolerans YIM 70093 = DSM 44683 TaxID=1121362 RepID=M1NU49_9CORY|nr:MFS transporter [Corynebacterium halotolerans]AGF72982.1 transporter [Corynebacterium halotolerans YIM 70093 = DSM 44683]